MNFKVGSDMKRLLDDIKCPEDIKKLSKNELTVLSEELRSEILQGVSKTGGHLSSNLGVIELTVALLYVLNLSEDQIVWDVGHQTYAYKLLTGRSDLFSSLRMLEGYSGFPKREESPYDFFNTGHSSTSISAALGLLRAKHLLDDKGKVIAIIGDGALTGGMAFEALDDTGQFRENLLVILNDNQMSIDKNVGGLSRRFSSFRANVGYLRTKGRVEWILKKIPFVGNLIFKILSSVKDILRLALRKNHPIIFEDLGFRYYGPVDGHDIPMLLHYLQAVQTINEPVLLHVCTRKGKGYAFAEESPSQYHGVTPFDQGSGCVKTENQTFTSVFGNEMVRLGSTQKNLVAVCAAMMSSIGLGGFREHHKLRFFDVGIAESHAFTMAAGMAVNGMIPVIAMYSSFIQRAYDQILHDICLQKLHVVLAIDRAGIVGPDGETHQGLYDISILMAMPEIEIFAPRDFMELSKMLTYAVEKATGPVAIRYPKGGETLVSDIYSEFVKESRILQEGSDISFLSVGVMASEVVKAAIILEKDGFSCEIIDLRILKPLDENVIIHSAKKTRLVVVCEDGVVSGGISSAVSSLLLSKQIQTGFVRIGVGDHPVQAGTREELFIREGMDGKSIADVCKNYFSSVS